MSGGSHNLWAVGASGGRAALALRWRDGWREVRTPAVGAGAELHGVAVLARRNAWAVGEVTKAGAARTLIEHWSAGAWSAVAWTGATGASRLLSVAAVPHDSRLWAVGETAGGTASLVERHTGATWRRVAAPSPGGSANVLAGVAASSSSNAWAVGWQTTGGATTCLAEHWDGTSWRVDSTPALPGCSLAAVARVPGTGRAWAVGSAGGPGGEHPVILHRRRGAWELAPSPAMLGALSGVEAVRSGVALAVGWRLVPNRGRRPLIERLGSSTWVPVKAARIAHESRLQAVAQTNTRTLRTSWAVGWSSRTGGRTLIERHLTFKASPHVPGLAPVRVRPVSLRRIDHCFYAPSPRGLWPVSPVTGAHPIRAGFNDPHGGPQAHFGVDVASRDRAPVYAVTSGSIRSDIRHGTGNEAFTLPPFFYYHVTLGIPVGSSVGLAGRVGRIFPRQYHVHLSEAEPGCGLVDLRRPTGILHDRSNREPPVIADPTAVVGNAAAFRRFKMGPDPIPPDPATPLSLTDLHGVVDIRASITDTPRHATRRSPQQPEMVAGGAQLRRPPRPPPAPDRAADPGLRWSRADPAQPLLPGDGIRNAPHPRVLHPAVTALPHAAHPPRRRHRTQYAPLPERRIPLLRDRGHHREPRRPPMLADRDPSPWGSRSGASGSRPSARRRVARPSPRRPARSTASPGRCSQERHGCRRADLVVGRASNSDVDHLHTAGVTEIHLRVGAVLMLSAATVAQTGWTEVAIGTD